MAKVRSPNYPLVDLGNALIMARKLYEKDGRNKVSKESLAAHLGHDSLSGPALGKIGALRAYGLVDGGGDEIRISDDAINALMAPEGSPDKADSVRRLALQPALFRDIAKDFSSPPSESNLRYWLVKRGFLPEGAAKAAKTYLATIAILTGTTQEYYERDRPHHKDETMKVSEQSKQIPLTTMRLAGGDEQVLQAGMRQEVFTLDQGDVTIIFPENLSSESFEDLEDHLRIFIRKIRRRIFSHLTAIDGDRSDELS